MLFCLPFNTALAGEIFSTGFESGLNGGNGFSWQGSTNTTVSKENPNTGEYSLRFKFKASDKNAFAEHRFRLAPVNSGVFYPEIWIKYDLYIPANYNHRRVNPSNTGLTNNKGFVWLWTDTGGSNNNYEHPREGPKIGGHIWANSKEDNGESRFALFSGARINGARINDTAWDCSESKCNPGKSSHAILENDRGHWMTIVVHAKYATEAKYLEAMAADGSYDRGDGDGVVEIWKTNWQGETIKLVDVHHGHWYGTQIGSAEPARGFNYGYLLGWANSGFNEDTILHIDNITFSTTPLVADYVSAPKPPTILVTNN